MNIKLLQSLIIFILFSATGNAQSFISLSTGISANINKPNQSFYHIPLSLQWKPSPKENNPFFVEFDYGIPFIAKSSGNAYTLNPSLPAAVNLEETICPNIFTVSIGFRIFLYTNKKNNSFYLNLLPFGISNQNFKVTYKNYDKENYEVLNPDVNKDLTGFVASVAAVYNFHKGKQDMMIMLHLQSPTTRRKGDYPLSYKSVAPLQLTFGYNFYYNKGKIK